MTARAGPLWGRARIRIDKRPVRPSEQAKHAPARHRPDGRSARPDRWLFHYTADRLQEKDDDHVHVQL